MGDKSRNFVINKMKIRQVKRRQILKCKNRIGKYSKSNINKSTSNHDLFFIFILLFFTFLHPSSASTLLLAGFNRLQLYHDSTTGRCGCLNAYKLQRFPLPASYHVLLKCDVDEHTRTEERIKNTVTKE